MTDVSQSVPLFEDDKVNGSAAQTRHNAMRLQDGIDVAILADWTWTYQYVTAHADRAAMFAVLGFAIGAILLLVFLIVRLLAVRRRVPSKSSSPVTTSSSSPSTIDRHHHQQHRQPPKQQQQHSNISSTFPPENSESVALLSSSVAHCTPGGVVFSTRSDDVYNASSLSRNSQRRRPDRVHFAPPSDAELTAASGAGRSQGTSFTDDTMASPSSAATSLNDVFFPASSSTPGPAQQQQQQLQQQLPRQTTTTATATNAVAQLWQMPGGVVDDGLGDVDVGTLVRNDTSRGSFYSNPYRHDTLDGRIRTSRAK